VVVEVEVEEEVEVEVEVVATWMSPCQRSLRPRGP
jgi:uncharacterized metal-binding protein YceD (DUF177 family)